MSKRIIAHQYWFCNPFSWMQVLIENKGVKVKFLPKAILITFFSLISFPFQIINSILIWWKGRHLYSMEDPVFIVGHWRGGTTLLHYILAQDSRFGYLTYYHAFIPNLAIIGGKVIKKILENLSPSKRPQDNIRINMDLPTEEENPLSTYSKYSASHSFFFPNNESYFQKYVLFQTINAREKLNWQKAYKSILKRISAHQKGKQLLIKNPHNTGRISELIEMFPKAKFIHIYRNPYDVFSSSLLMYDKVIKTQFLQDYFKADIFDKIFYYYSTMMKRYFKDRSIIPKEQLVEIKFEEFEKDPMEGLKRINEKLNLSISNATFSKMKSYLEESKNYKKNVHHIPLDLKERINNEWDFGFKELGYEHE